MRREHGWSKSGCFLLVVLLILAASAPGLRYSPLRYAQAQDEEPQDSLFCAATEFQIHGQEWEFDGGVFGFAQGPLPSADIVDYTEIARQFDQATFDDGTPALAPDQHVVVLVVDDFHTLVKGLSHGDYVYEVADHTLTAARARLGFPYDTITLDGVDVRYSNVSQMVDAITQKLVTYIDQDQTRFVLNMSFSLVPCRYTVEEGRYRLPESVTFNWNDFNEKYTGREGNYSLIQYVADTLAEQNSVPDSVLDELLRDNDDPDNIAHIVARAIVYDWIGTYEGFVVDDAGIKQLDPLLTFLQSGLPEGIEVLVPVASAGNYGGYIPPFDPDGNGIVDAFAPASWPEVISVSSTPADSTQLSAFSNAGGVSAPGQWHPILSSNEYVAGTSFAAPVTSILVALMQSTSSSTCDFVPWEREELLNAYLTTALPKGEANVPAACTP